MSTTKKKRIAVHVTPSDDKWAVKIETRDRAEALYDTKDKAVDVAVEMAKRNEPSQVKIHRQDGTFQEERTYGDDPVPPRG